MQKFKWIGCSSGAGVLLLGLILLSGQFLPFGSAHAQTTKVSTPTQHAAQEAVKEIVVSISKQWMDVYQNGQEVYNTPVTTGSPSLPTPLGTYHIFYKVSPTVFRSPFPRKSKYWYPPVKIQYAMEWKAGGFFIHDAWWHTTYGPGTNVMHYDPAYGWQEGSHGCISVPLDAAKWLYSWTTIGTTVKVVA